MFVHKGVEWLVVERVLFWLYYLIITALETYFEQFFEIVKHQILHKREYNDSNKYEIQYIILRLKEPSKELVEVISLMVSILNIRLAKLHEMVR